MKCIWRVSPTPAAGTHVYSWLPVRETLSTTACPFITSILVIAEIMCSLYRNAKAIPSTQHSVQNYLGQKNESHLTVKYSFFFKFNSYECRNFPEKR